MRHSGARKLQLTTTHPAATVQWQRQGINSSTIHICSVFNPIPEWVVFCFVGTDTARDERSAQTLTHSERGTEAKQKRERRVLVSLHTMAVSGAACTVALGPRHGYMRP